MTDISIEALRPEHWDAVRAIYLEGIATGNATFQETAPDWKQWDEGHLAGCRLIARSEAGVLGWAALSAISRRPVYAGVAEVSIYVAAGARGRGLGTALMVALIEASEQAGMWTLQSGIFPENVASFELHQRHGFRVVGVREKIGCMNGRWRDVVMMERRSTVVGI
jgi:phosphinothricin acetyltransferase